MKKIMIAAAAMAAGVAMADITSKNVVGYKSYADASGFNNIAAAFTPINESKEWTFAANVYDTEAAYGDQVAMLNTEIFDLDYYGFLGYNEQGESLGWQWTTSDPETAELVYTQLESFKVAKSQVTYCIPNDAVTAVTTAGQVDDVEGATVHFAEPGFYDFTNPFPIATTFADLSSFCEYGDQLAILNTEIFDLDYYGYLGAGNGWQWTSSDPETGDLVYKTITDMTQVILPAGVGGYFMFDSGSRTWNVTIK